MITINDIVALLLTLAWGSGVTFIGIALKRFNHEFARKFIHLFLGFYVFFIKIMDHIILEFIPIIGVLVLMLLVRKDSPFKILQMTYETLGRAGEKNSGILFGPVSYECAILILVGAVIILEIVGFYGMKFFPAVATSLSILFVGDGMAAFAQHFNHKVKKTNVGSLFMFAGSIVGASISLWILGSLNVSFFFAALLASVLGTIVERISGKYDNLTVPLVSIMPLLLVSII
ncbi:MAG: hypothetical protein QXL15_05170 [Candidatus Korarchaeota archaeon]